MDAMRQDRHEREARVAMVLVSLPLPPLPVLACRGEDAHESVCSSHDLHAVMMATDGQRAAQGAVTAERQENCRLRKCALLNRMREKVQRALAQPQSEHAAEDAAYAAVCAGVREYFAEYAHVCSDVRVCALDSVVRGDAVHAQMVAYVRAHLGMTGAENASGVSDSMSYRALFGWWVRRAFE